MVSPALRRALAASGFKSVADFLKRYPTDSYIRVGDRLSPEISGMMLLQALNAEVVDAEHWSWAVADSIVREILDVYPNGYEGNTLELNAKWIGRVAGNLSGSAQQLPLSAWKSASENLQADPPPLGWKLCSTDDPVVQRIVKQLAPARRAG